MRTRTTQAGIANDPWYLSLPASARLLYHTLLNSIDLCAAGTRRVTIATLSKETALPDEFIYQSIPNLIAPFAEDGRRLRFSGADRLRKVWYWPEYDLFWLVDFYADQRARSHPTKYDIAAARSVAPLPTGPRSIICEHYATLAKAVLSLPESRYSYGTPVPPAPAQEQEVDDDPTTIE